MQTHKPKNKKWVSHENRLAHACPVLQNQTLNIKNYYTIIWNCLTCSEMPELFVGGIRPLWGGGGATWRLGGPESGPRGGRWRMCVCQKADFHPASAWESCFSNWSNHDQDQVDENPGIKRKLIKSAEKWNKKGQSHNWKADEFVFNYNQYLFRKSKDRDWLYLIIVLLCWDLEVTSAA